MELIVVLFIISIMFVFAIPEVHQGIFRDDTDIALNWIVLNVGKMKKDSRHQGKDLFMCIHPFTNSITIRESSLSSASLEKSIISTFSLPENVHLEGVKFNTPGRETDNTSCIQFYKNGYSDHAIIHVSDNDRNRFSCLIQPFLHKVKIYEKYIEFE